MSNPFLFDDEIEPAADTAPNPFLLSGGDVEAQAETENPFLADNPEELGNPFAFNDDSAVEPPHPTQTLADTHAVDKAMSFFGTTITDDDDTADAAAPSTATFAGREANASDSSKKAASVAVTTVPPPRPTPPQPTTQGLNQELISSVVDQLDQNSSHLLDRIPKTRTPSPVSMRDLHTPSPTPESANLLMSDVFESDAMDGGAILSSDNPFANVEDDEPIFPVSGAAQQKGGPPRPAPPRPTPPPPPPQPQSQIEPANADTEDLFDFGINTVRKPPAPKSNQDILNLFAAPKAVEPPKPDLMSSDILMMGSVAPVQPNLSQTIPNANVAAPAPVQMAPAPAPMQMAPAPVPAPAPMQMAPTPVPAPAPMQMAPAPVPAPAPIQMAPVPAPAPIQMAPVPVPAPAPAPTPVPAIAPARPAPPQRPAVPPQRPTPPVVPRPPVIAQQAAVEQPPVPLPSLPPIETKIPNAPSVENIQKIESEEPEYIDTTESMPISSIKINDEPYNGLHELDKSESISDNSSAVDSSIRTPGIATPFYSPGPDAQYLDRGQTPVDSQLASTKEEMLNTYINEASAFDASTASNPFGSPENAVTPQLGQPPVSTYHQENNDFDAFSAKFESVKKDDGLLDSFGGSSGYKSPAPSDAWGENDFVAPGGGGADASGFEADEGFDSFLAMQAPPEDEMSKSGLVPPPSRGSQGSSIYAEEDRSLALSDENKMQRTGSQESPSTPLFDDDVSQPLEDFPRISYTGDGWDMYLRQPNKKKFTAQRFWKKIFMRIAFQNDTPVIQMFNTAKDKEPFQELPLQGCYSVSDISAQPFDQFGKIFTIKLQYILYKERPGVRPGQVTKAERITNKLSQFAAYAIQGDYQGVKEFGSDLRKLGLPVEHHPHVSELFKIGAHSYEDVKHISVLIEEQFFKFNIHRDRALTYKFEEVQITGVDEFFAEQTYDGLITRQIARVRLFFLAFLNGMPTIELGVNDMWRQGKEVVGRHDIIPVATEEWIRLEGVEFHACVQQNEYERSRLIRFQPPDACYIELMRFRVRPPKNRELPLQVKAVWCVTGKKVELRADVLVPGVTSRKHGQIPCEDVSIRFPIPECWIYLFRVEKHFRYGSVKSAHRRTGKIKGIERILGTVDQLQESLIEVTSGQAKYEHHHRAIVWRCPRLPKDGQGAYTTHQMVVRMALTSYDQIPDKLAEFCYVEYTMPQTVISHATIRSVSVQDSDSDDPPEKYVRYLSRYEYQVGIEYSQGQDQNPYLAATYVKKESPKEEKKVPAPVPEVSDSDSDSN